MKFTRLGFKSLIPRRRSLRKNSTKAEQILWKYLRAKRFEGIRFRRQHGIGPYITDFCAPQLQLVIEVDGDIHAYTNQKERDEIRTQDLVALGYRVVRYTNRDVYENIEGVLEDLLGIVRGI